MYCFYQVYTLAELVQNDWYRLGLHLQLGAPYLDGLKKKNDNEEEKAFEVLKRGYQQKGKMGFIRLLFSYLRNNENIFTWFLEECNFKMKEEPK